MRKLHFLIDADLDVVSGRFSFFFVLVCVCVRRHTKMRICVRSLLPLFVSFSRFDYKPLIKNRKWRE